MHPNGAPRLSIDPPSLASQVNMYPAISPADTYFSSPATYSPLPFTQQVAGFGGGGGYGPTPGFFPGGRKTGIGATLQHEVASDGLGMMTGSGLSQIPQGPPPSMLRSSSASSRSSASSFIPSTPYNASHFSPPMLQSSPLLFSPPLPSSPTFANQSPPRYRNDPLHPDRLQSHSRTPTVQSSPKLDARNRFRNGTDFVSLEGRNEGHLLTRLRPSQRGDRQSVHKLPRPVGIGTRPDDEVKKRKKVTVKIPRERATGNTHADREGQDDTRTLSSISRCPLNSEEKSIKMRQMERDQREGTSLEEDELVGRPFHFDEVKTRNLPSTIEVYLPGVAGWDVAWQELSDETITKSGAFNGVRPAFLAQSSLITRSPEPFKYPAFPASSPTTALPPSAPHRSHTRTYSLFNSPVALPARLQNVLDSLSRRTTPRQHAATMSLAGDSPSFNLFARSLQSFTTTKLLDPSPPTESAKKLKPLAPIFSMPATNNARAQAVPLPDNDDPMEEELAEKRGLRSEEEKEENTLEKANPNLGASIRFAEEARTSIPEAASSLPDSKSFEAKNSARGEVDLSMAEDDEDEDRKDAVSSRRTSCVSTRTDRTGVASLSDGFSVREGEETAKSASPDFVESPLPLETSFPVELATLVPLPASLDLDCTFEHGDGEAEESTGGTHKVNQAFEFPARSTQKARLPERKASTQPFEHRETLNASLSREILDVDFAYDSSQRQSSRQASPNLFGTNGGPGPLAASLPSLPSLPCSPPISSPCVQNNGEEGYSSSSASVLGSSSIVCPIPRRPHQSLPSTFDDSGLPSSLPVSPSSAQVRSFDFVPPVDAPLLSTPFVGPPPLPRRVGHGPLPPIPLVQVELQSGVRHKGYKVETEQGPHSSSNSQLEDGTLSIASLEDAIPPQYSPSHSREASYTHLGTSARGRRESEDILLPSSSRPRHRALPVPPTVPLVLNGHPLGGGNEARHDEESGIATEEGSLENDDTPLRILEGILEQHFESLRNELRSLVAVPSERESLVEAVADRIQLLFSAALPSLKPIESLHSTTPALESQPAASYDVFLDNLKATIQPLVQPPLDVEHLVKQLSTHRHQDPSALADILGDKLVGKLESLLQYSVPVPEDPGQNSTVDGRDLRETISALKGAMAQLSLDVTSRLDCAYSALEERLPSAACTSQSLMKLPEREQQLQDIRIELEKLKCEKAAAIEKHELDKTRHAAEVASLRDQLAAARSDCEALRADSSASVRTLSRVETDLVSAKHDIANLNTRTEALIEEKRFDESKISELKRECGEKIRELGALRRDNVDLQKTLDSRQSELDAVLQQERSAKGEILALERRLAGRDERIEQLVIVEDAHARLLADTNRAKVSVHPRTTPNSPCAPGGFASPDRRATSPINFVSGTPPSPHRARFSQTSDRSSTPTKLRPQYTGDSDGSDLSDTTVAHTSISPTPSVASRFSVCEEGWYTTA